MSLSWFQGLAKAIMVQRSEVIRVDILNFDAVVSGKGPRGC